MRIAVATAQVPFIAGGAEIMTDGLCSALQRAGHKVERVTMPFRFGPASRVLQNMDAWEAEDFDRFDCGQIDQLIALKFPAFYAKHHSKRVWLMHQHRSCYELWNTPNGDSASNPESVRLREQIMSRDTATLRESHKVFTISQTVSDRLMRFNNVASTPLLQPPAHAELYECGSYLPYIFVPSRLETLKRQHLLIEAMAHVDRPVFAVIAGEGGQRPALDRLVAELGLGDRVLFLGRLSDEQMRKWYANSLAVFFGPLDEDYGFITLEAMLSAKAVITCKDSGGPLYFVRDGQSGVISDPKPEAIAAHINRLNAHRALARDMGQTGRDFYRHLNISWDHVVATLLAD